MRALLETQSKAFDTAFGAAAALVAAAGTMGGTSGALYSLGLTAARGAAQTFANPTYPKTLTAAASTMGVRLAHYTAWAYPRLGVRLRLLQTLYTLKPSPWPPAPWVARLAHCTAWASPQLGCGSGFCKDPMRP